MTVAASRLNATFVKFSIAFTIVVIEWFASSTDMLGRISTESCFVGSFKQTQSKEAIWGVLYLQPAKVNSCGVCSKINISCFRENTDTKARP